MPAEELEKGAATMESHGPVDTSIRGESWDPDLS